MSRKDLRAGREGTSERYLANLETGTGNASVLLLRQVAARAGRAAAPWTWLKWTYGPTLTRRATTDQWSAASTAGWRGRAHGPAANQRAAEFSLLVQWLAQLPAGDLSRVREAARHALVARRTRAMRAIAASR